MLFEELTKRKVAQILTKAYGGLFSTHNVKIIADRENLKIGCVYKEERFSDVIYICIIRESGNDESFEVNRFKMWVSVLLEKEGIPSFSNR